MTPKHHLPTRVAPLDPTHLPQLRQLLNAHLGLLAPGWALTEDYIASHLQQNPGQAIVDPWVSERKTLCALEGERLVAAAHLLRYSRGSEVGPTYAGAADIAWCVAWAEAERAASALLAAATRQMHAWGAANEYAWDAGLPVGPFVGVPDVWPHIAAALTAAGFQPTAGNEEVVLGGALDAMPAAGDPPLPALVLQRRLTTGPWASREMRFTALLDGQQVGKCEVALDLTDGGALPALRDWAQLTELAVAEPWRNQGIGAWLVRHAVAWLRLGRRSRLLVAAMADNAGAIRFYRRCGWEVLVRERKGWQRAGQMPAAGSTPPSPPQTGNGETQA